MIQNGLNPTIYTDNTNKYEHITNGEVKLHNLTTKDTGLYKIDIVRELAFGTQTISDEAYLTVIGKTFYWLYNIYRNYRLSDIISDAAIINKLQNISTCAGQNVLLDWKYDRGDAMHTVLWYRNDSPNGS